MCGVSFDSVLVVLLLLQDEPCTPQLYVLCDMCVATVKFLAHQMGLDVGAAAGQYPGSITLPKGLYRPLDKDERGESK